MIPWTCAESPITEVQSKKKGSRVQLPFLEFGVVVD